MTGWKTKTGAILLALAPSMSLLGLGDFTEGAQHIVQGAGMLLGVWGVGHKIEKQGR